MGSDLGPFIGESSLAPFRLKVSNRLVSPCICVPQRRQRPSEEDRRDHEYRDVADGRGQRPALAEGAGDLD